MSLILIAVIYNMYFSPSTFKYVILMQKVKYVPAHHVNFVWSQLVWCSAFWGCLTSVSNTATPAF